MHTHAANRCFLLLFLSALLLIPWLTFSEWDDDGVSYYEQRRLEQWPDRTRESLWTGAYFTDIETALLDHIWNRTEILKANTKLDFAAGRPAVNGLVVRSDALLTFYRHFRWKLKTLDQDAANTARRYAGLQRLIRSWGGCFCYLGVPMSDSYFADQYPDYIAGRLWQTDAIRSAFAEAMDQRGVPYVDLYAAMRDDGETYYYTSDHHYTMSGAWLAYQLLMDRLQTLSDTELVRLERDDLNWTTLPNPFLGSSNRKLYGLWENQDRVEIASLKKPVAFTRQDNGYAMPAQLFQLPKDAAAEVDYNVYMGGDQGETILRTNRPELPNALIYGDSFTNPLETILWTGFNETRSLDLRYYSAQSLRAYLEDYRPDVVICVRDEVSFFSEDGNGQT